MELLQYETDELVRTALELALQSTLGLIYTALEGYGSPLVAAAYARARELCTELGDPPRVLGVLYGQAAYHIVRGTWSM